MKEKKIRGCKIYSPYSQFLGKGFNFERKEIKGMNLIVRLNEEQTLLESFLLHRSTKGRTEHLNFFLGKYYYRDINLFYVYDTVNKQWLTSGPEFFNEAICEKVRNKNFNLTAFARQYYYVDKKGNGYAIGHADQRAALGNRKYLMPIIYDRSNIYVAPNEIFYTTANADHLRGRTFLRQYGMKNMGTYELTSDDKKELTSMLPNFKLKTLNKLMKVYKSLR